MNLDLPRNWRSRFYESIPGILTWVTFIGLLLLARYLPAWVAIFFILYSLWWLVKAVHVSIHLVYTYRRLKEGKATDWLEKAKKLDNFKGYLNSLKAEKQALIQKTDTVKGKERRALMRQINILKREQLALSEVDQDKLCHLKWDELHHIVIFPTYKEPQEVLESSIQALINTNFPKDKLIVALSFEERSGRDHYEPLIKLLTEKYGNSFFKFYCFVHPDGIEGEAKVKGANSTYAAQQIKLKVDKLRIPYDRLTVSNFDSDTQTDPEYFGILTYRYLTTPDPTHHSYQPVPMFFNNLWDAPALSRISSIGSSFWQMIEASRYHRLVTFSSHSMSFDSLVKVRYWPIDIIQDDSQIFWRCFVYYQGKYDVVPLNVTVTMDAVLDKSYWITLKNQYLQKLRWAYGVGDIAYMLHFFLRRSAIPVWKRIVRTSRLIEGHYTWSTTAVVIAIGGWLPFMLGDESFMGTALSQNFWPISRILLTAAFVGIIISIAISTIMLPPRPAHHGKRRSSMMILQWALVPLVTIFLGSFPAIDAQTRWLLGKRMEFFVTPKVRKSATSPTELANQKDIETTHKTSSLT